MRRVNIFAAVVAVLVAGGCNGGSEQPPDTARGARGLAGGQEEAAVLETAGDTVKKAHVRVGVVCADGHVDVHIRGWTVIVHRGAEVKWHLDPGRTGRVTVARKDTADTAWGLARARPFEVSAGDSISGGEAQRLGTWRYNLHYECQLGDSTYQGVIDPEVIIVPVP